MSKKSFTPADVSSHNNPEKGLYVIIDKNVYDVTNFIDEHPGGANILKRFAGKDASKQFWKVCNYAFCLRFTLFSADFLFYFMKRMLGKIK
jgi:cytochrome b involved in lipid metabolism